MSLLHFSFVTVGFLVLCLCAQKINLPNVLYAWKDTCVQIPCNYQFIGDFKNFKELILFHRPQYDEETKTFSGTVLYDKNNYLENQRAKFLGRPGNKNCSTLIRQVQVTDSGELGLRVISDKDKWISLMQLNVSEFVPQPHIQLPQRLQESQKVTVTCSLNYFCPEYPVSLQWSLEGKQVPLNQVKSSFFMEVKKVSTENQFTFIPNWTHHGKNLTCQLWHLEKKLSHRVVQLDVKHTPKLVIHADPHTEVKEGESVTLTCELRSSNPTILGGFFWFKNKENEHNGEESLHLSSVTWQQAGDYHCEAENEMGRGKSESLVLQVRHSPKLSEVKPDYLTVMENATVELTCTSLANPLPTNYTWFQDEKQMLGETKEKLQFQKVNRQQAGQYTCLAENSEGQGEVSKGAKLDVQYPPFRVTVTIVSQTPVREGDSVILLCSYEKSNPSVSRYSWTPQLYPNVRSSPRVTIQKVSWNAEPVTCKACNSQCSSSAPLNLDVQYAPKDVRVSLVNSKSDIQSGDQVSLRCDYSSSHPRNVHYIWTRNGKYFSVGRDLNWNSISPKDSGLYKCFVNNSIGQTQSLEWDLKVQYAPRHLEVSITPSDVVMEKTGVVLTCKADAYPPIEIYHWFDWKGQRIDSNGQKLTLWPVMTHQSGAYWCQGTNKWGTGKSHPTILTVYYSPETIGKRTALGFGVCLAVLLLAILGFQFVRCWKKIREQNFQEQPRRQGSFFIRKKKIRRPQSTALQSSGYYNPAVEERVDYATLQFPPRALWVPGTRYLDTSSVNLQTEDQSATYSVVQKPHRSDYENVNPHSAPEEEGVHYSELIQFGEGRRPPVQEGVEYVTLKY